MRKFGEFFRRKPPEVIDPIAELEKEHPSIEISSDIQKWAADKEIDLNKEAAERNLNTSSREYFKLRLKVKILQEIQDSEQESVKYKDLAIKYMDHYQRKGIPREIIREYFAEAYDNLNNLRKQSGKESKEKKQKKEGIMIVPQQFRHTGILYEKISSENDKYRREHYGEDPKLDDRVKEKILLLLEKNIRLNEKYGKEGYAVSVSTADVINAMGKPGIDDIVSKQLTEVSKMIMESEGKRK
ncbi:hypothetical protein ACFL2B_00870 [Patescibacteria group bacterium]